jgi:hypothetical protein
METAKERKEATKKAAQDEGRKHATNSRVDSVPAWARIYIAVIKQCTCRTEAALDFPPRDTDTEGGIIIMQSG